MQVGFCLHSPALHTCPAAACTRRRAKIVQSRAILDHPRTARLCISQAYLPRPWEVSRRHAAIPSKRVIERLSWDRVRGRIPCLPSGGFYAASVLRFSTRQVILGKLAPWLDKPFSSSDVSCRLVVIFIEKFSKAPGFHILWEDMKSCL